jgi:hypothetical protein
LLIIHIGTQKTGTSALQSYLAWNAEMLLWQGIRYLEAGRPRTSHSMLAQSLQKASDLSVWSGVRRELAKSDSRINLISAEGFWFADPAAVKAQLGDIGDVRVIVYLRRQDQYLQSLWKQAVCGGRKTDFAQWRDKLPYRGDYFCNVERWSEQFGEESIVVRPYVRNGTVDTIGDFCRIIGASDLPPPTHTGVNPSPRRELLHFIRAFNCLDAEVEIQQLFRAMVFKNESYARSCDILSDEECVALMDSFAEGNRRLIQKYYRDDTTPLFPAMTRTEPRPVWNLDSEEFFKLTTDVLEVVVQFAAKGCIAPREPIAIARRHRKPGEPMDKGAAKSNRALKKALRAAKRQASVEASKSANASTRPNKRVSP